jgi:hypothetical protein
MAGHLRPEACRYRRRRNRYQRRGRGASQILLALRTREGRLYGGTSEQVMRTLDPISKDAGGDAAVDAVEPEVRVGLARRKIVGLGAAAARLGSRRYASAPHVRAAREQTATTPCTAA